MRFHHTRTEPHDVSSEAVVCVLVAVAVQSTNEPNAWNPKRPSETPASKFNAASSEMR
jgi:hypothetical protein